MSTDGKRIIHFSIICCILLLFVYLTLHENRELSVLAQHGNLKPATTTSSAYTRSDCKLSFGKYSGSLWTKYEETVSRTCLLESMRMRVDHHSRKLPDGNIIDDWLWIDYGDRVNVLVREESTASESGKFIVFEQTKYALISSSLAVVGGFIEPNETPEKAALREVREELQLYCNPENLKALGMYRTDVNRGLGWVHGYLAEECVPFQNNSGALVADADSKQEAQTIRHLSLEQLEEAVIGARFVEVQWTAAVAVALIHIKRREGVDIQISSTYHPYSMSKLMPKL